jgi:hypothetical protein
MSKSSSHGALLLRLSKSTLNVSALPTTQRKAQLPEKVQLLVDRWHAAPRQHVTIPQLNDVLSGQAM